MARLGRCVRITSNSDLAVTALLRSLIGGTEATGHEAEAKFQKKTQERQICPSAARPGTRQGRGVEQPQLDRRKAGLSIIAAPLRTQTQQCVLLIRFS